MRYLYYPSASLIARVVSFLLNFFATLLYMRSVMTLLDSLLRRFSRVSFVGTQVLIGVRTLDDNPIEDVFQLTDIMPVCPGYDYRERDATLVY